MADAGTTERRSSPTGRRWVPLASAAAAYLALALMVWLHVWTSHPTSTTTCGCGDSALFLWFFAWPAHAMAHGLDPFHSGAMSIPAGVDVLADTSVLALGVVLAPITWIFGPVASMNVALTLAPALSALAAFVLVRRWVAWTPAAFAAGLLYGFSPFVLVNLTDAHLMNGFAAVAPLIVACADELLFTRRHRPALVGLVLGLLVVVQFFVSTEILLVLAVSGVLAGILLAAYGLAHRPSVRIHARRVVVGLATAAVTAVALLVYPVWVALAGPAHPSGRVWPTLQLGFEGATGATLLTPTSPPAGYALFTHRVGGYQGPNLSPCYIGIGVVVVAVVGALVWRRDRRLWFFGAMALLSAVLALGASRNVWLPWEILARRPLFQNIIPDRFVVVTLLSLAVVLGIVVDRTRTAVARRLRPSPHGDSGVGRGWPARLAGLTVAAVAVVPLWIYLGQTVPVVVQPVQAPTWFTSVAPRLSGQPVLLVFPVPYQVIESAMAWQAVTDFPFVMVGGGGPGGAVQRAGREEPGAEAIGRASFSFTRPSVRAGDVEAARAAMGEWGVTSVVLPDQPGLAAYDRVTSVAYTTGFMTAVTDRAPTRQAGSWVWAGLRPVPPSEPTPNPRVIDACVNLGGTGTPTAIERVARCVLAAE